MKIYEFDDRQAASAAAARRLSGCLRDALSRQAGCTLIVSGGSTPVECLSYLADESLAWDRVRVLPSDERCVAENHIASNRKMIREHLLRKEAAPAQLQPLEPGPMTAGQHTVAAGLLGMGVDGHFASIFADAPDLVSLTDLEAEPACFQVATAASEFARVTANLALLLTAPVVVLLAFGAAKKKVLMQPAGLPIAHLLRQTRVPVEVFWAH